MKYLYQSAAAALVLSASSAVFAGPITLDFELPTAGNPPVGSAYAGLGIEFTGANTLVNAAAFPTFPTPPAPGSTFVVTPIGQSFTLDVLDPAQTAFDVLSLSYLGPLRVVIEDVLGNSVQVLNVNDQGGTSYNNWVTTNPFLLDRNLYGEINSITFFANGGTFAIDNVSLSLQGTPPNPNPVPEPAGYALAALALLGAGLMSRRRRG